MDISEEWIQDVKRLFFQEFLFGASEPKWPGEKWGSLINYCTNFFGDQTSRKGMVIFGIFEGFFRKVVHWFGLVSYLHLPPIQTSILGVHGGVEAWEVIFFPQFFHRKTSSVPKLQLPFIMFFFCDHSTFTNSSPWLTRVTGHIEFFNSFFLDDIWICLTTVVLFC